MKSGVIDRIEDKYKAVILLEDENREWIVDLDQLPDGCIEGSWLLLDISGHVINHIQLDRKKSIRKQDRVKNKMNQLRAKSTGSRFKRN